MEIFLSPFPFSYVAWLGIFVVLPTAMLWVCNFSYFKRYGTVFGLAIIGGLLFAYPWDIIAIRENIWFFEEPQTTGIWFGGLPAEEWLFIILMTLFIASVTLAAQKRFGSL